LKSLPVAGSNSKGPNRTRDKLGTAGDKGTPKDQQSF
jgi:hypothetical protein